MNLPDGRLVRSRVITGPGEALETALDRELTGYTVLAPQDTLLLDADGRGVVTFEAGVPVLAYHTGTDRGGARALGDLAVPGPYQCDLYEVARGDLATAHESFDRRVPPGLPAERLAGDSTLADRTRAAAPPDRLDERAPTSAVAAFLDDEDKIRAIRDRARQEAERRAREWGLDDQLEADRTERD